MEGPNTCFFHDPNVTSGVFVEQDLQTITRRVGFLVSDEERFEVNVPASLSANVSLVNEGGRLLLDFLIYWFAGKSKEEFDSYVSKAYAKDSGVSWRNPSRLLKKWGASVKLCVISNNHQITC